MSDNVLEIRNLAKHFRSYWTFQAIQAVSDVSLCVKAGESFGFLGHNGAGKTTTIKCIVGLIHASAGQILLNGKQLTSAHQRCAIGYLPEHPYFYDHLKVLETLDFLAGLAGLRGKNRKQRVAETLELVSLTSRANSTVRSLSKGLQQRLGFAQAIVHRPELLLLDEPFSGLDPIGRKEIRELILSLRSQGTTIFISSHILSDVQDICDRVSIMANGQLCRVFDLRETSELFGERYIIEVSNCPQELLASASEVRQEQTASGLVYHAEYETRANAQAAIKSIAASGAEISSYSHSAPSLEDVFVEITQEAQQKNSSGGGS